MKKSNHKIKISSQDKKDHDRLAQVALKALRESSLESKSVMEDFYSKRMTNPMTGEKYTNIELLKIISEDAGRLQNIEYTLKEEGENLTIYNRIKGIELRTYEAVNVLFSIKRLAIAIVFLLAGILLCLYYNF